MSILHTLYYHPNKPTQALEDLAGLSKDDAIILQLANFDTEIQAELQKLFASISQRVYILSELTDETMTNNKAAATMISYSEFVALCCAHDNVIHWS